MESSSSSSSSSFCWLFFMFSSSLILFSYQSMAVAQSISSSSSSSSSMEKKKRGCHDDEMAALLQFKHSFVRWLPCSNYYNGYEHLLPHPKTESWEDGGGGDCCSWEGVECDEQDDHHVVVGLDLSGSCLFGSINSSSSLFTLTHLQRLNLSYNNFNYSHIPSSIGNLSRLTHLNLSSSYFTGQIPHHLSNITTLVSLDLSFNYGLEVHSLKGLRVQHLINLKELHLSQVSIASGVPHDLLSNFSSLESLDLSSCELKGEFPAAIFYLPKLKMLDISFNPDLKGFLPNFHLRSPLQSLWLSYTGFGGVLPPSIGNLASLQDIDISHCNFTGKLPMSLGNLTQLTELYINDNQLMGPIPSSFMNLTRLTELDMRYNRLTGSIPSGLMKLPQLESIDLSHNILNGQIPSNFNPLISMMNLSSNNLQGFIPAELTKLKHLNSFDVSFNNLSGPIPHVNQFCKFDSKLFVGNPGLSIETWSKHCEIAMSLPQVQAPSIIEEEDYSDVDDRDDDDDDDDNSKFNFKIKWMVILIGFVGGLVNGVILGNELTIGKQYWFLKIFARKWRGYA